MNNLKKLVASFLKISVILDTSNKYSVQFSSVAQSCLNLSDPIDGSLPGSSAHGIFQARVLECVAIVFSGFMLRCVYKSK